MDHQQMKDAITKALNEANLDVSPQRFRSLHMRLTVIATDYQASNPYIVERLGPPDLSKTAETP